ncbi:MAG: ATP-binding protein [Verrucomicrobiaceae bacterium]|nr:ATP-binding protein [Verrucomicrobiaceae bacterium]
MVKNHPSLRWFAHWMHDNNLWHLNRYSASLAVFIGLFAALIPLPSQMPIALVLAIWWRAHVPISVALVWLTNPLTSPPIFYGTYKFGNFLLQREAHALNFEASLAWLGSELGRIWAPLLVGSLTAGIVAGLIGAGAVRLAWRVQVGMRWSARKKARANK